MRNVGNVDKSGQYRSEAPFFCGVIGSTRGSEPLSFRSNRDRRACLLSSVGERRPDMAKVISSILLGGTMNTSQRGNLAQSKVITRLIELGYSVYLPFGDGEKAD